MMLAGVAVFIAMVGSITPFVWGQIKDGYLAWQSKPYREVLADETKKGEHAEHLHN